MSLWDQYAAQVDGPSEHVSAELESRLANSLKRRDRRRAIATHVSYALVGIAAALVVWFGFRGEAQTPEGAKPLAMAPAADARTIVLPNDGTLDVEAGAEFELDADARHGAEVQLFRGAVTLDVHQAEGLSWVVRAGAYKVAAIGTRFRVRATGGAPEVTVYRGLVELTGPDLPPAGVHLAPTRSTTPARGRSQEPDHRVPVEQPAKVRPPKVERFRRAFSRGDTAAAVDHLPPSFPARGKGFTASDYLNAGDALAAQGQPKRARKSYALACRHRTASKACAVATYRTALMLGRAGRTADAVTYVSKYLKRQPRGPLARQALGRRMRWQQALSRSKAAEADARDYLARWPSGPEAAKARRIISGR